MESQISFFFVLFSVLANIRHLHGQTLTLSWVSGCFCAAQKLVRVSLLCSMTIVMSTFQVNMIFDISSYNITTRY